ncbi:uncharacterized protein EHS24_007775 [Apiotrichum porosum]|uniref:Uncharacterized protein n=1 Tax=Apiotrichum porosum TaxID=105984 RepID=A0A427XVC5_9TREE|nr:uncharacterized protein EHS24_007775 [Apiotrichum porosum]RSH82780.1 hypothetical protein EHS24_007775 [Apiotrichum porosum]
MPLSAMQAIQFLGSQFTWLPRATSAPILTGKTVILTGANSGIGWEAGHQLAAMKPKRLILACRDMKTGAAALESVLSKYPGTNATVWNLDLASFENIKEFAARANKELDVVDVAVLNAAMNPGFADAPMKTTVDGHEVTQQVNILSTILLSLLLQPLLAKSVDPTLVITSSEVHMFCGHQLIANAVHTHSSILAAYDDKSRFVCGDRYFESKLLLQLVIRQLIGDLPDIKIVAVNPGMCRSNLGREMTSIGMRIGIIINNYTLSRSAWNGAVNVTKAIEATESQEYWSDCAPAASSSVFLGSATGHAASKQYYHEVMAVLDKVSPGCTAPLGVASRHAQPSL